MRSSCRSLHWILKRLGNHWILKRLGNEGGALVVAPPRSRRQEKSIPIQFRREAIIASAGTLPTDPAARMRRGLRDERSARRASR